MPNIILNNKSIYLSIYLSIYISFYLSIYLSIYRSIFPFMFILSMHVINTILNIHMDFNLVGAQGIFMGRFLILQCARVKQGFFFKEPWSILSSRHTWFQDLGYFIRAQRVMMYHLYNKHVWTSHKHFNHHHLGNRQIL